MGRELVRHRAGIHQAKHAFAVNRVQSHKQQDSPRQAEAVRSPRTDLLTLAGVFSSNGSSKAVIVELRGFEPVVNCSKPLLNSAFGEFQSQSSPSATCGNPDGCGRGPQGARTIPSCGGIDRCRESNPAIRRHFRRSHPSRRDFNYAKLHEITQVAVTSP